MDVPADLVGTVVGVGGAGVRALEAAHGTRIVVGKPDGSGGGARRQAVRVQVFAPSADALAATRRALLAITGLDIQPGERYKVKVMKLADYGAFVKFPSGHTSLLHISEIAQHKIRAIEDELQVGQTLEVMCIGRSPRNTAKVSRRALLGPVAVPGAAPQPRAATAEGEASAPQPRAAAAGGADGS